MVHDSARSRQHRFRLPVYARILAALFTLSVLLTACGGGSKPAEPSSSSTAPSTTAPSTSTPAPAPKPPEKKSLKIGIPADVVQFDPHQATDLYSHMAYSQIIEPLLLLDLKGNFVPSLATAWKASPDGKTWTFTIRKGVKFHNGDTLMPDDVKYSIERVLDEKITSPRRPAFAAAIDTVTVQGDDVILNLKKPNAGLLATLTNAYIIPKKVGESLGKDGFTKAPVGTGPFKFVERKPDEFVKLEVFADYWGGKAKIDEVVLRPIPDASTRTVELETGGVDLVPTVAPSDVAKVEKNEKLRLERSVGSNYRFIFFNVEKPPFDNQKVRLAVAHAINKEAVIKAIYAGTAEKAEGPIPPVSFAYDKDFKGIQYDVEKAKALLKESGVTNLAFDYMISTGDQNVREAQLIQSMLTPLGFTVNIKTLEWGTFLAEAGKGNFNMARVGWTTAPEPNELLYARYHSGPRSGFNWSGYKNPQVDKALDDGLLETDPAKRATLYRQAQKIIVEEAPEFHIFHEFRIYGVNKRVEGFQGHFAGYVVLKSPSLNIDVTVK